MNKEILKKEAKKAISRDLISVIGATAIIALVFISKYVLIGIIGLPLIGGFNLFLKKMLLNNETDFNEFKKSYEDLNFAIKIILTSLLRSLYIIIGLVLFIVPGVIMMLKYSQTINILMENKNLSVTEALKKSGEIMDGHKQELFDIYLSFIGHFLLCIITAGIWSLYTVPYVNATNINYYLYRTNQKTKAHIKEEKVDLNSDEASWH